MKIMDIAIFLFIIGMVMGAMQNVVFFGSPISYYAGVSTSAWNSTAQAIPGQIGTWNYNTTNSTTATYAALSVQAIYGMTVGAFTTLLMMLSVALNMGGFIFSIMPFLPAWTPWVINGSLYCIYGWGLIQFWSGRSGKLQD
jgi:hypothetical protein